MYKKVFSIFTIAPILISFLSKNNFNNNFKNGVNFYSGENNMLKEVSQNSGIDFSNFKNSYFYNLTENYSRNVNNSCGYVGISMLLSYYDTFLSDDIIPEIYDKPSDDSSYNMLERKNSPGVINDYIKINNIENYYKYITTLDKPSFQGKLMEISYNKGLINLSSNKAFYTSFDKEVIILKEYFKSVLDYDYGKQYTLNRVSDNVKDFVISQIKKGYPVLLSLKLKFVDDGHVVVAYDYDENKKIVYCHTGYNSDFPDFNHFDIDTLYETYKDALTINFNISHKHSDNYKVGNKTYCYNDCDIVTYYGNDKEHHYSKYEQYNSIKHKYICSNDDAYVLKGHAVESSKIYTLNGHMYGNCIDCNYLVDLGSTSVITPTSNLFISKNGSYMLENGIYIIQKEDLEAYLNGTLFEESGGK